MPRLHLEPVHRARLWHSIFWLRVPYSEIEGNFVHFHHGTYDTILQSKVSAILPTIFCLVSRLVNFVRALRFLLPLLNPVGGLGLRAYSLSFTPLVKEA